MVELITSLKFATTSRWCRTMRTLRYDTSDWEGL